MGYLEPPCSELFHLHSSCGSMTVGPSTMTSILPRKWWAHLTTKQMEMQEQIGEEHIALESYEKMLAGHLRELGPDHECTLWSQYLYAGYLHRIGDHAGALSLARQAAEGFERAQGTDHPRTVASTGLIAEIEAAQTAQEGVKEILDKVQEEVAEAQVEAN